MLNLDPKSHLNARDFEFWLSIFVGNQYCNTYKQKKFDFCSICYWNETKTLQIHFNLCFSLVIVMIFVMGSTILRGFSYLFQHFWEGLNLRRPRVSTIQISRNLRSQNFISWIQLMSWAIEGLNCVPKKVH